MSFIDAGLVQQMFGDDLPLFKSLLTRILRDYADLALPICVSPDDQTTRSQLMGRAHKLKGSAGMIGAITLMRLAGATEKALQECRSADIVEGILGQLAVALVTLRDEAGLLMETQPARVQIPAPAWRSDRTSAPQISRSCARCLKVRTSRRLINSVC
jgi:HPt (histidine-containing phosphotransfer) domain-containing protein